MPPHSLEDDTALRAPARVSLPSTIAMKREAHVQLQVVLLTLLGQDHPATLDMQDINTEVL